MLMLDFCWACSCLNKKVTLHFGWRTVLTTVLSDNHHRFFRVDRYRSFWFGRRKRYQVYHWDLTITTKPSMQIIPLSSGWHPDTSTENLPKKLQNICWWSAGGVRHFNEIVTACTMPVSFWILLSMTSWLSLSLAETSGNAVGGHANCAGWSWLPWSTVQNRSGWRSNGQRDVNMCQKSLYSWVDVTAVRFVSKKWPVKERWRKGLLSSTTTSIWRCEVLKLLPLLCAARSVGPQFTFNQFHLGDLSPRWPTEEKR